ncbi:hypothetical protein [Staphylococcus lutrae]|uniref:Lipoprotein n=1 Tax=Staphylococcus lutrae TaxID=155085 RepID=A0AAC9RNT1_9STAP|nr:hypothetical protein [Staphylococcus lutrae]ARJ50978.1 hypothetical protein B5P37_06420 [Staphylococcus lutrae]PNZ37116.1 hypothetical protein CD134_06840 [Staphylococcus lutrae]
MKKLTFTLFALLLILSGCGGKDAKKEASNTPEQSKNETTTSEKTTDKKSEDQDKATTTDESQKTDTDTSNTNTPPSTAHDTQQQAQNDNQTPATNKQKSQTALSDVSLEKKVALALFGNNIEHYTVTQSEVVKGVYTYQGPGRTSEQRVTQLTLQPISAIPNSPEGMKFYTLSPAKGNFVTIIGVNDDKVFVGGTQGALVDYQKLLTTGKEMRIQNLYEAHHNDPALQTVANKIKFTQS